MFILSIETKDTTKMDFYMVIMSILFVLLLFCSFVLFCLFVCLFVCFALLCFCFFVFVLFFFCFLCLIIFMFGLDLFCFAYRRNNPLKLIINILRFLNQTI
jgi:hypothetical protein